MLNNTCLFVDIWGGQTGVDMAALKQGGVSAVACRLNDMQGGHHMDSGFQAFWDAANAAGIMKFPYFVYNPWVDGPANFAWLQAHMPNDAKFVAIDIEVAYPGYQANTYAGEVVKFYNLCAAQWKTIIYTAQWFLPYLTKWPAIDYWWAQYPGTPTINACKTWDDVTKVCDTLSVPGNSKFIPGILRAWQFTGDVLTLPGSSNKMDVNIFYGSESDLASYIGGNVVPTPLPITPPVVVSPTPFSTAFPRLFRVKDDIEILAEGGKTRPYLRVGLPGTVRAHGGKGAVNLSSNWVTYVDLLQGWLAQVINYIFKIASGWHNQGAANNVQELTFSGNVVKVLGVQNGQAYIETFFNNNAPPTSAVPITLPTLGQYPVQLFTTQYRDHLDMSNNGLWPKILLIANAGEQLWMDMNDLAPYEVIKKTVTVKMPSLRLRSNPIASAQMVGGKVQGQAVNLCGITVSGNGDIWGRIDWNTWMALKYQGQNFTDWLL